MSDEIELKQATQDILHAEKALRELAERVKAYQRQHNGSMKCAARSNARPRVCIRRQAY